MAGHTLIQLALNYDTLFYPVERSKLPSRAVNDAKFTFGKGMPEFGKSGKTTIVKYIVVFAKNSDSPTYLGDLSPQN